MSTSSRQRGAAALGVTLLLLFVLTLVVAFAGRNLLFERRAAANQIRATQAFEAAEAGLAWAQAMLDSAAAIDERCEPSTTPGAPTFRERLLRYDAATQRFMPRTWIDAGAPAPLQAACVLDDEGWRCSCPAAGRPTLDAPAASGAHPAFLLQFTGVPRSGLVQLVATGCDRFAPACLPGLVGVPAGDAGARIQVLLGLLPALATAPVAALNARGEVRLDGALALVNTDAASGGLTVQAGGAVTLPLAALTTLPGLPAPGSVAPLDGEWADASAERLQARLFGLDRARWQALPGLASLDCPTDCTATLAEAAAAPGAHQLFRIDGDLLLDGPVNLGSAGRPLLLVVGGRIRLRGGVQIHGVVVSLAAWDTHGSENARIDGAVVALGDVVGDGTPTIAYDPAAVARLHAQVGHFAVVPGSWRDF